MSISSLRSSRSVARRVAAATAALGMVVALSACGSDDESPADGDSTNAAATASGDKAAGGEGDPAPGEEGGAEGEDGEGEDGDNPDDPNSDEAGDDASAEELGQRPAEAPTQPINELLLSGPDAAAFQLSAIPEADIAQSVQALSGLAEGARVEPAECSDFNATAMAAQASPGTTALAVGQAADAPVSVAVTTVTSKLAQQSELVQRCPEFDVFLELQDGGQYQTHTSNRALDVPAPEGVELFSAVEQESTYSVAGQEERAQTIALNGKIRGIGVTVASQSQGGTVSDAARQSAIDLFNKQVESIRNA